MYMFKIILFIASGIVMGSTNATQIVTLDKDTEKHLTTKCQPIN
jgi:hypothetical protein